MIGRGAYGRPWLLGQVMHWLRDRRAPSPIPSLDEQYARDRRALSTRCSIIMATMTGVNMARKHIGWYTKGLTGSAEFRNASTRSPIRRRARRCWPRSTPRGSPARRPEPLRRRRAPSPEPARRAVRRAADRDAAARSRRRDRRMPMPQRETAAQPRRTRAHRPAARSADPARRRASTAARGAVRAYDIALALAGRRARASTCIAAPMPDGLAGVVDAAPSRAARRSARAPTATAARRPRWRGGDAGARDQEPAVGHSRRGAAARASGDDGSRDLTTLIRDEVDRIAALIDRMEVLTDSVRSTSRRQHLSADRPCARSRARRVSRAVSRSRKATIPRCRRSRSTTTLSSRSCSTSSRTLPKRWPAR